MCTCIYINQYVKGRTSTAASSWFFPTTKPWCTLKQMVHTHGPHHTDGTQKEIMWSRYISRVLWGTVHVVYALADIISYYDIYVHCNYSPLLQQCISWNTPAHNLSNFLVYSISLLNFYETTQRL